MKLTAADKARILAELDEIKDEVEKAECASEEIPEELKLDEEAQEDLTLDNANPMMAADEDDIESLELEDEEKGEEGELTAEADPIVNIKDIIKSADDDGNVKMSCIKALVEIPDDKADDDIIGSKKASLDKPGPEDEIGDEANGGDPSTSELKKIIGEIDDVADDLQKSGKLKAAWRLDRVANTLQNYNLNK